MKWKDTGADNDDHPESSDPYYEEDGYPAFKEQETEAGSMLSGNPVRYLYWGLGIAVIFCVVLILMLLFSNINDSGDITRIKNLEQRIEKLEQTLAKMDGVDEKVTHIWEQAKAFETFKTRFDRSEASTSLRMDHLAMSLDALQKKMDQSMQKVARLEKAQAAMPESGASSKKVPAAKKTPAVRTHTVVAGDTLYSISRKYNLTVQQLRSLNSLGKGAVIHVGQTLKVN